MNLHVSCKLEIMIHRQSFASFKNTFLVCKPINALLVSNVMHKLFVIIM